MASMRDMCLAGRCWQAQAHATARMKILEMPRIGEPKNLTSVQLVRLPPRCIACRGDPEYTVLRSALKTVPIGVMSASVVTNITFPAQILADP